MGGNSSNVAGQLYNVSFADCYDTHKKQQQQKRQQNI